MAAFYVALFIIRPWEKMWPALAEVRFERIYALCMIAAVTVEGWRVRFDRQTVSVLAFFAAIAIACLTAWKTELAVDRLYKYLTLLVFYFVLLSVVRGAYSLVFLVACYGVAMGLYLSKAFWEYAVHGAHHYTMGVHRMIGIEWTFGGPNDLATSIVLSMPMLLFVFRARKAFTATWPKLYRWLLDWAMAGYLVLALTCLVLTNSRAGMVCFIFWLFVVVMSGQGLTRKLLSLVGGVVLLGLIWLMMPEESQNRLRTVWDPEAGPSGAQVSAMGRIEGMLAGWRMFVDSPLTGVGPGNFIPYRVRFVDGVPADPHNLVGQTLGETGLIGTIAFLAMVGITLGQCHRTIRLAQRTGDGRIETMALLSAACRETVLILLFDGLFGHNQLRFSWLWAAAFSSLAWQQAILLRRSVRPVPAAASPAAAGVASPSAARTGWVPA